MTACTPACGFCGRCTAAWDDEDRDDTIVCEFCSYCNQPMADDVDTSPYCSRLCAIDAQADSELVSSTDSL